MKTNFYFSQKQADFFRERNERGGSCFGLITRNYINGRLYTECSENEEVGNWGDYVLVDVEDDKKIVCSREVW